MAESVAGISQAAVHLDTHGAAVEPTSGPQGAQQAADDIGRYRLTIERESAGYVYKTLDRVTGEIIHQLPREEVLKLRQSPAYDAGKIIKTEV